MAEGKWSPAEVVLHVTLSYEFARAAVTEGAAMRLRVPPVSAWLSRHLLLPLLLRTTTFPRGAASPTEVRPSSAEARTLTAASAGDRLARAAAMAASVLRSAEDRQPGFRVTHAYFGSLSPRIALRLLSAHTRHHVRQMNA